MRQLLEEARDDPRLATVVSTDEPVSTALDHFIAIDIIFEVRVPDWTGVFKLWTLQAFVCRLFDFRLTVAEVPSQQAKCSVGLAYYLVDVAWPKEVITDGHAKVWVVFSSLQNSFIQDCLIHVVGKQSSCLLAFVVVVRFQIYYILFKLSKRYNDLC